MLRSMGIMGFSTLTMGSCSIKECANVSAVYTQAIRWKRKPIWLPTAPSKLFRVPKRPNIPQEEVLEIRRLYNYYRTEMKSIRKFIQVTSLGNPEQTSADALEVAEEEYQRRIEINNEWNEKVARDREDRLVREREELKAFAEQRLEQEFEQQAKLQEQVAEQIRKAKALAPHVITRENIDKAIEEALKNPPINYDYAIDINGNKYTEIFPRPFNEIRSQTE